MSDIYTEVESKKQKGLDTIIVEYKKENSNEKIGTLIINKNKDISIAESGINEMYNQGIRSIVIQARNEKKVVDVINSGLSLVIKPTEERYKEKIIYNVLKRDYSKSTLEL